MSTADNTIRVVLIEPDQQTVEKITGYLAAEDPHRFEIEVVADVPAAISGFDRGKSYDLVLLRFEAHSVAAEQLRKKSAHVPIIFLGGEKDLAMAVEALRVGGNDFLPLDGLDRHVFPQTLLRHHDRRRLIMGVEHLDVRRERLEAMQELVVSVSEQISEPLEQMHKTIRRLEEKNDDEKAAKYLALVRENLERLADKMDRLRNLKHDKTVKYIKNINMIDLS